MNYVSNENSFLQYVNITYMDMKVCTWKVYLTYGRVVVYVSMRVIIECVSEKNSGNV